MTVYVDDIKGYGGDLINPEAQKYGKHWCHMWTDGDIEELHKFAKEIGLKKAWFQNKKRFPHYDLVTSKRKLAIENGATYISLYDWYKQQQDRKL